MLRAYEPPEDSHALAWLAGFWDGEGCVITLKKYETPQFALGQSGDEGRALCQRVLDSCCLPGCVNGPYLSGRRKKPHYVVRITSGYLVEHLLEMCRPWLSRTKIDQAERSLTRWHAFRVEHRVYSSRHANECRNGHPYTEESTYYRTDGARRCRICHAEAERARYATRRQRDSRPREPGRDVGDPLRARSASLEK